MPLKPLLDYTAVMPPTKELTDLILADWTWKAEEFKTRIASTIPIIVNPIFDISTFPLIVPEPELFPG